MARIERFEDMDVWQKARGLAKAIYQVSTAGTFRRDRDLRGQVRRASVSIMSNIAEGFERGRASEFHQFLSVAKSSCGELRSHLYVALDAGYLTQSTFDALQGQADEVGRIVGGLRASAERRRDAID